MSQFSLLDTKIECKNEGQQIQWIKMQNAGTVTPTKQNTLLQEKNQTAILNKNHIQNNVTSSVNIYILILNQKHYAYFS
jgi:hypothetical protein